MTDDLIPVIHNCDRCDRLCEVRTQIVNGKGKAGAKVMFVGQNPGANEDKEGLPFVGKSGKLLAMLAEAAGIPMREIYRTNAVRCLSPGNAKPKREEIENCRQYLIDEIRAVKPQVIVTLGEVPLQALYGFAGNEEYDLECMHWEDECESLLHEYAQELAWWEDLDKDERKGRKKPTKPKLPKKPKKPKGKHTPIKDVAGHSIIQPDTGIPIVPTYHPAFLLRGKWAISESVISHLQKAWRIAQGRQKVGDLGHYSVVKTIKGLKALRDYLIDPDNGDTIWFDSETTGLKWMKDELLCLSFATKPGEGFVVPILHNPGDGQPKLFPGWEGKFPQVLGILREIFASEKDKGGQNVLYDLRFLERAFKPFVDAATAFGIKVNGRIKDTELAHHAIAEALPHNMTSNLALWTDMPFYEDEIKQHKKAMAKAPNEVMWPYSAADADGLPRLWTPLREQVEKEGVDFVLDNITMPMLRVCRDMEERGLPVDVEYFERLCQFYELEIEKAETELWERVPHREAGWKYNYAPTLRDVLFKELKLPVSGRKTNSGRGCKDCADGVCFEHDQTGRDALKDIREMLVKQARGDHPAIPVIDSVLLLKNLTKRSSTYLRGGRGGMWRYIRPDGRIHASMKISRAETGRLASELPNVQNIPNYVHIHPNGAVCSEKECTAYYPETFGIDTSNAFHDIVMAPEGKGIMNCDWAQLEVWVLAYRLLKDTGDRTLLDVLESGVDIHLYMGRKMFPDSGPELTDKEWKETYPHLRRRAKACVFGVGYGLTPQGLMLREHMTEEEAELTISRYLEVVPGLKKYFRIIRTQLLERGWVANEFGRRRHIGYLSILKAMGETMEFEAAIREGINMPIQSGGSDLHSIVSAATNSLEALHKRGCFVIGSVHDSLTFEFDWPDNEYALQTAWIIKNLWSEIAWNFVKPDGRPLHWKTPCEVEWGKRWGTPEWKLDMKGNLISLKGDE